MSKVNLDSVEHRMAEAKIDSKEIQAVITALKKEIDDAKAAKQAQPKIVRVKYIIANTAIPAGTPITETPMLMVEAEEDVAWNAIVDEIKNAANAANNDVKKLTSDPITSIFDAFERVPAKFFKERHIRVISKEMPQVLETDNKIT